MTQPYPEAGFANDHERWAEQEAVFCDQMVESMTESAKGYAEKALASIALGVPNSPYAHHNAQPAYECTIRANVWQQMADNLRRPRVIRIENSRNAA